MSATPPAGAIAYIGDPSDAEAWHAALRANMEPFDWRVYPDLGAREQIDVALCWRPPAGLWPTLPNLKLIVSMGMGVDHLFRHGPTPERVPIVRINDFELICQMAEYVTLNVLRIHREDDAYSEQQRAGIWRPLKPVLAKNRRVGIMGLGEIGHYIANSLGALGFDMRGWSRTRREDSIPQCYAGAGELEEFLSGCDILVNVLALTEATRGIVNARTLGCLPRGAHVINIARGGHVVDADLLAALDRGHVASATLDVFNHEPLPADHPYWRHPKVRVTPHVAGPTFAESSAPGVAENIIRVRAGMPLNDRIDPARGY